VRSPWSRVAVRLPRRPTPSPDRRPLRDLHALPALASQVRRFAVGAGADGARRYERICTGIASDEELLSLIAGAPPDQRRPNILLAAVHYLLLSGADEPLARHYPTVAAWRGVPFDVRHEPADPFPSFASFCRRHREPIATLIATRATQTNEVGRCAALLPAFAAVATLARRPLAIVDLGASAGLNLLFDRYAYDYGDAGRAGAEGSPVRLRCELRSGSFPVGHMPEVVWRLGVDRRLVDLHDEDGVLWLLACQWPDHLDRFVTMRAAVDLARTGDGAPVVMQGDVVSDLGRAVAGAPGDDQAHLCVFHSWVAAYLDPAGQAALVGAVREVAMTRPVSWVFAEMPYEVPKLPVPPADAGKVRGATALVLVSAGPENPAPPAVRLGDMHSHGRWLHWYGDGAAKESAPADC
jgi:hypothetical protein